MRLFVTGATGVLGRRVVPLLLADRHEVSGLSRSDAGDERLRLLGALPVRADLFDAVRISDAISGCDGILHLATAIPTKARTTAGDWTTNDRIRREGTANLLSAARRHGCRLFVQQSVTLLYGDRKGAMVDEATTVSQQQPALLRSAVDMEHLVRQAVTDWRAPAVILRFGTFVAPDAAHTSSMLGALRAGKFPVIGDGRYFWNLVSVDDAAAAVRDAVRRAADVTGMTFNIVDDTPVQASVYLSHLAGLVGGPEPRRIPRWLARFAIGQDLLSVITASVRCDNSRVKQRLHWSPRFPTYRELASHVVTAWTNKEHGP